jgi:flagellar FliL protein
MAETVAEAIEPKEAKRSLGKMLLLGINLLLFVSGAAFFLLTKFGIINNPPAHEVAPSSGQTVQSEQTAPAPAERAQVIPAGELPQEGLVTVPLLPFVVNLNDQSGQRYLRLTLQLEVKGDKAKAVINQRLAQIRDRLIFLLSSKTFDDIRSAQGKYQLQSEISQHLNEALGAPLVVRVYFTEFIVQ